ncbi:MAG: hypothetical protein ACREYE_09735 [Gammaproteobacteria bacterium]
MKKSAALGISCSGGARNPHVFQYTLRFLRSGGTRPLFARDDFFTSSQAVGNFTTSSQKSSIVLTTRMNWLKSTGLTM